MTIESTPPSQSVAKASQATGGGKAKTTQAAAGDTSGFFAMLSAADDALGMFPDTSSLSDESGAGLTGAELQEEGLERESDANVLVGWMFGVPVPVAQEAPPSGESVAPKQGTTFFGGKRSSWSPPDAEAQSNMGLAVGHKSGKVPSTADLQKTQIAPVSVPQQGDEDAPHNLPNTEASRVQEVVSTVGMESRVLAAPLSGQAAAAERRLWEPIAFKAAPVDGVYFQPQSASAPMGMDGVVSTQSSMPLEAYVAEQVTYWIAQDVQNAELTLDGFGLSPVEVSISMQGNEAQVAFRTDELHARDAIERASEQLKDSLQRQGVVLTGMSVGTSHSGDASRQGGRSRPDGRQATVAVQAAVPTDSPAQSRIPQGRALDLFV